MGYIKSSLPTQPFVIILYAEDQHRINTFSKLNTRVRSLAEKVNSLKVCSSCGVRPGLSYVKIAFAAREGSPR